MTRLTSDELKRYCRHVNLAEIGERGQELIGEARVLIVGAGGLGSPVAYYLTAAGVGTLGIVDSDLVDLSNLQRQILHFTTDIGRAKVESASGKLKDLNPNTEVQAHRCRLDKDSAFDLISRYDIVVDATDNLETRFLANDICVRLGRPFVHGAVLRFIGQAMTVVPGRGPCYRCVFKSPPPPESIMSPVDYGLLGTIPGIIGTIQATEVIKIITSSGTPLIGRLLIMDALRMEFDLIDIARDPHCVCACS